MFFDEWPKHARIELTEVGDEQWLVGKGRWRPVDVLNSMKTLRTTKRTTKNNVDQAIEKEIPIATQPPAYEFASITNPEEALNFANRFGLLGLNKVSAERTVIKKDKLSAASSLEEVTIALPGPNGEMLPIESAREALYLTPEEFREALAVIGIMNFQTPIFYPELISAWLKHAHMLRRFLSDGEAPSQPLPEAINAFKRFYDFAKTCDELSNKDLLPKIPKEDAIKDFEETAVLAIGSGRLRLTQEGNLLISYERLRDALFLQAAMEKKEKTYSVECAAPGCHNWLVSKYKSSKYCSERCKRRVNNRKSYAARKRRKRAQRLLAEGRSRKEVAETVNVSIEKVKEWIKKGGKK